MLIGFDKCKSYCGKDLGCFFCGSSVTPLPRGRNTPVVRLGIPLCAVWGLLLVKEESWIEEWAQLQNPCEDCRPWSLTPNPCLALTLHPALLQGLSMGSVSVPGDSTMKQEPEFSSRFYQLGSGRWSCNLPGSQSHLTPRGQTYNSSAQLPLWTTPHFINASSLSIKC